VFPRVHRLADSRPLGDWICDEFCIWDTEGIEPTREQTPGFTPAWVRFPPYLKCKIHHSNVSLHSTFWVFNLKGTKVHNSHQFRSELCNCLAARQQGFHILTSWHLARTRMTLFEPSHFELNTKFCLSLFCDDSAENSPESAPDWGCMQFFQPISWQEMSTVHAWNFVCFFSGTIRWSMKCQIGYLIIILTSSILILRSTSRHLTRCEVEVGWISSWFGGIWYLGTVCWKFYATSRNQNWNLKHNARVR